MILMTPPAPFDDLVQNCHDVGSALVIGRSQEGKDILKEMKVANRPVWSGEFDTEDC